MGMGKPTNYNLPNEKDNFIENRKLLETAIAKACAVQTGKPEENCSSSYSDIPHMSILPYSQRSPLVSLYFCLVLAHHIVLVWIYVL